MGFINIDLLFGTRHITSPVSKERTRYEYITSVYICSGSQFAIDDNAPCIPLSFACALSAEHEFHTCILRLTPLIISIIVGTCWEC